MKYYTQYKGIWYAFIPSTGEGTVDSWRLSDREDDMGNLMLFNADIYRIDECFKEFINERILYS